MNIESVMIPEDFFFVDLNRYTSIQYSEICRVLINHTGVFAHSYSIKHGILIMRLVGYSTSTSTSLVGVEVFPSGTPEFDHWLKLAFIEQVMK